MRFRKLSPRERQVYRRVLRRGQPIEYVAWILGITVKAVRVFASKARKKMKMPGQAEGLVLPHGWPGSISVSPHLEAMGGTAGSSWWPKTVEVD